MAERTGLVTLKGNPLTLEGDGEVKVGEKAPDFKVSKSLLEDVSLADFAGKTVVLNVVPSLDTPVCSVQTARFNSEAANLGGDVVILTISMDLPPAQARWCQANSAEAIVTASDYKHHDLGRKYCLNLKEIGLLARAVYVIAPDGTVRHAELVPEVAQEPNYDAALEAVKALS